MKLILISALLAAVLVCSCYGQTCMEVTKCIPQVNDSSDQEEVCRKAKKSLDCLDAVLADCKKTLGDNPAMKSVEDMMDSQRQVLSEHCGCSAIHMSLFTLLSALLVYMFL